MSDEANTASVEAPEVNSSENYNQAAYDYIESQGLGDEAPAPEESAEAASPETVTQEPEATEVPSLEDDEAETPETDGEESEEVEAAEESEEDAESYQIEVNGKRYDYTLDQLQDAARTGLELEIQRETWEGELTQTLQDVEKFVGQHEQDMQRLQLVDAAFDILKNQDPTLAEDFENALRQVSGQLNNPVVQNLQKEVETLRKETVNKTTAVEDQRIREEWGREVEDLQKAWGPKLKSLGVKADWDNKVKDAWINSGTGSVKAAFFSVYGENIAKLSASKRNVATTQKQARSQSAKPTAGGGKTSPGQKVTDTKGMSYSDIVEKFAAGSLKY